MLAVFKFFSEGYPEYKMTKFRADWALLTDQDKADLKNGIADGTLNY